MQSSVIISADHVIRSRSHSDTHIKQRADFENPLVSKKFNPPTISRTNFNNSTSTRPVEWWNQSVNTYSEDVFGRSPSFSTSYHQLYSSNPNPDFTHIGILGNSSRNKQKRLSTKELYEMSVSAGKVYSSPISTSNAPLQSYAEFKDRRSRQHKNTREKSGKPNMTDGSSGHVNRLAANSTYGGCLFALKSTSIHTMVDFAMKRPQHPLQTAPLMLPNPCLISVTTEDTISRAIRLMLDNNVRAVAIFGTDTMYEPELNEYTERVVFKGIVSVIDFLNVFCSNMQEEKRDKPGLDLKRFTEMTLDTLLKDISSLSTVSAKLRNRLRRGDQPCSFKFNFEDSAALHSRFSNADDSVLELIDFFEKCGAQSTPGNYTCIKERLPVSRRRRMSKTSVTSLKDTKSASISGSSTTSRRSSFSTTTQSISTPNYRTYSTQSIPVEALKDNGAEWGIPYRNRSRTISSAYSASSVEKSGFSVGSNSAGYSSALDSISSNTAELLRMTSVSDIVWFAYANSSRFPDVFTLPCKDVMTWCTPESQPSVLIDDPSDSSSLSVVTAVGSSNDLEASTQNDKKLRTIDLPSLTVPAVYEDTPTGIAFRVLHSWGAVSALAVVRRQTLTLVEHLCVSDIRFLNNEGAFAAFSDLGTKDTSLLSPQDSDIGLNVTRRRSLSNSEMFAFEEIDDKNALSDDDSDTYSLQINELSIQPLTDTELLQLPVKEFIDRVRGSFSYDDLINAIHLENLVNRDLSPTRFSVDDDETEYTNKYTPTRSLNGSRRTSFSSAVSQWKNISWYQESQMNIVHPEPLFTVKPNNLLKIATDKMMNNGARRVWVVDEAQKPIGVIEPNDIVATLVRKSPVQNTIKHRYSASDAFVSATSGGVGCRGSVPQRVTGNSKGNGFSSGSDDIDSDGASKRI